MVTTHKILTDLYEETYALLALHCSLADYALVYALNRSLKTRLRRSGKDLDMSENISFPFFEWKDELNHRYWTLITNHSRIEDNLQLKDLFRNETSFTIHHLVPEYREVDYFLKIEQDQPEVDETILKMILSIPRIVTAYPVNVNKLKSKNNLIF
jgi:hypothetical protein